MTKPEPLKPRKLSPEWIESHTIIERPKRKPKRKSRIWACSGFKNSVIFPEKKQ